MMNEEEKTVADVEGEEEKAVSRTASSMAAGRGWANRAEEILRSELGAEEFNHRLEIQRALFKKGCTKGGLMDYFSISSKKSKVKGYYEAIAKQQQSCDGHAVGSMGYVLCQQNDDIPDNDFFVAGCVHEVRARHSNNPYSDDDRRLGHRSLCLKLADHDTISPLDLVLQTGCIGAEFNADMLEQRLEALDKGGQAIKRHLLSLPIQLQATIEGFRKRPDSYYHQYYYSHLTFDFAAHDQKRRVARFRCVPADGSDESGRLTPQEQREAWYYMLLDKIEEDLPSNYLKQEFMDRIADEDIVYELQIQLYEWENDDNNNLYNPALAWDENEHPWHTVAEIHLTQIMPKDVTQLTCFNIGNLPKSVLSWPEGTSIFDFNIVPSMRKEITDQLQRSRTSPGQDKKLKVGQRTTEYLVHVVTGSGNQAGLTDAACHVYICIIGTEGRTPFHKLERKLKSDFAAGAKSTFSVVDRSVGDFLCAKVYKTARGVKSDWFVEYIVVTTPYNNKCHTLPTYRWLTDDTPTLTLREGNACTVSMEQHPYLKLQRSLEVAVRRRLYQWHEAADEKGDSPFAGLPGFIAAGSDVTKLPRDLRMENEKGLELEWARHVKGAGSFFDSLMAMFKSRKGGIDAEYETLLLDSVGKEQSDSLSYVVQNWRSDEEFGRQLLNTLAPLKLCEVRELPDSFPVTDEMMRGVLSPEKTLQDEIDDGKVFIICYPELEQFAQYEILGDPFSDTASVRSMAFDEESIISYDIENAPEAQLDHEEETVSVESFDGELEENQVNDVNANDAKSKKKEKKKKKPKEPKPKKEKKPKEPKPSKERLKYLCAPQVLLYNNGEAIVPIAIQLTQQATPPLVFTPRDDQGEYSDWLLAKMWVRVAEANVHHFSVHLLGSHFILEPIAIACVRNLPAVHPVHKLLEPHMRHIMAVNTVYRHHLLPSGGALTECLALGQEEGAHLEFLKQQYYNFKLNLLYLPDNFAERGVLEDELVPGYTYRDDCLKIWEMTQDFVSDIISIFYEEDEDVETDEELAAMLSDLRRNGFHRRADIPETFSGIEALVRFLSIVLFRCSAHHAFTSNVMIDTYAFVPNAPPCLNKPPPTKKRGPAGWTEAHMRAMLPTPELCARYMAAVKLMAGQVDDARSLGRYPDQLFSDDRALVATKTFERRLDDLSREIQKRNSTANCDYDYLDPHKVPNHVSS